MLSKRVTWFLRELNGLIIITYSCFLAKGGAGGLSQGRAKKLRLGLCAHVPPQKVVDKKLQDLGENSDAYRLTSFFSPPACGRQQKHDPT